MLAVWRRSILRQPEGNGRQKTIHVLEVNVEIHCAMPAFIDHYIRRGNVPAIAIRKL